ncbi:Bug family tripartite tricarboxylate transporter substrate binding protein [Candidimonas nitroreducens]|nr:tripartite tricarboxylate transporter substrate binding protein [Candidimonas nitroreducens]
MKTIWTRRQYLGALGGTILALQGGLTESHSAEKRIRKLIVPQGPGGTVDIIGRAFTDFIQQSGKTPTITENKPGAAGEIAADYVARSPADGMTLLVGNSSTMVVNPQVKKVRYDPLRDFQCLGGIVLADTIMVANASLGFKTLNDVISYARAHPGKLAFASNGVGGAFHLGMEYFQALTGTKLLHVPFNSAAQAELALVSNQVALMIANTGPVVEFIRKGKVTPLAVVGEKPSIDLPNLVIASHIIPGFVVNTWVAVYAPAATPENTAVQLNSTLNKYLKDPRGKTLFQRQGLIPIPGTLTDAARWNRQEMKTWGKIVDAVKARGAIS